MLYQRVCKLWKNLDLAKNDRIYLESYTCIYTWEEKEAATLKDDSFSRWKNIFIARVSVPLYADLLLLSLKTMSWRKSLFIISFIISLFMISGGQGHSKK